MAHRQLCTCSKPRPTSAACRTRIPSRPGADVPKPAAREQVPHEHGFYSSRIAPKRRGTNEMPRARACRRCPNQYRSSRRQPAHLQTSPRTAGCAPPGAKAADCAPLGAKEAAREAASDPDFPSHAALLADPGGGGSPVEGWLSRLGSYPSVSGAAQNGEGGGLSARIPTAQRPSLNPSNKILWAWSAAVARSPPCRCPRCPQRVDGGSVTMPSEAAPERNGLPFSSRPLPCGGGQLPPYF